MMIKTIKAKEGLKLGDKYMNNDLREPISKIIKKHGGWDYDNDCFDIRDEGKDELITLIRTATLDEVKEVIGKMEECWDDTNAVYIDDALDVIDNLRGKSDDESRD